MASQSDVIDAFVAYGMTHLFGGGMVPSNTDFSVIAFGVDVLMTTSTSIFVTLLLTSLTSMKSFEFKEIIFLLK